MQNDTLTGTESLPKDYEAVVLASLKKGKAMVPPELDVPIPTKNSHVKMKVAGMNDDSDTKEESPMKNIRKGKNNKEDVGQGTSTGGMASEHASRKLKTEDADQDSGNKETVAEEHHLPTKDADDETTVGQVPLQEKSRKRKKENVKDGRMSDEKAGKKLSSLGQTLKKRKTSNRNNRECAIPAASQDMEKRAEEASIGQDDAVTGNRTLPLRRSARQAAHSEGTPNGDVKGATSKKSKRGKNNQAADFDKTVAYEEAEIAPKGLKREAGAAKAAANTNPKRKAKKTADKKKRDREAATAATMSMANIAELREFIQANAVTMRAQRY